MIIEKGVFLAKLLPSVLRIQFDHELRAHIGSHFLLQLLSQTQLIERIR